MLSSKVNVLVIPSWYPSDNDPSYGIFTKVQCQLLQKMPEINLSVLYADIKPIPIQRLFSAARFHFKVEDNIPTYRMTGFALPKLHPAQFRAWARQYERLFLYYLRHAPPPDIFHAHDYLGGYAARFLSKKYNIPYVLTIHNSRFISHRIPYRWKRPVREILEASALIFCVSPPHRHALRNYTQKPIEVLYNPIDTDIFSSTFGKREKEAVFQWIAVGSLITRKNHKLLLEAFALFQKKWGAKTKLLLIGEGPLKKELIKRAKALGIHNSVRFEQNLPQRELAERFRQSHALILPSKYESFGMVAAEAMACGLPVIATYSGGPEHLITKASGMLVPPSTSDSMALSMYDIYINYARYNPQSISGSILNICDPAIFQSRLLESYRKIIAKTILLDKMMAKQSSHKDTKAQRPTKP